MGERMSQGCDKGRATLMAANCRRTAENSRATGGREKREMR